MAGPVDVTIRRQVLDVELHGPEAEGHALQRRLPGLCTQVVAPAIESALAGFHPGEAYLSLDRLEIELSLGSLDGFEAELVAAVRRGIADHFARYPPLRPDSSGAAAGPGGVEHRTPAQAVDEALITFLRTGRLPWAFRLPPGRTLETLVLDRWRAVSGGPDPPPVTLRRLKEVLAGRPSRQRLVLQFTPEFTSAVLGSLSPELAAAVARVDATLGDPVAAPMAVRRFAKALREAALQAAVAGRVPPLAALAGEAWRTLQPADRADRHLASVLARLVPGVTGVGGAPAPGAAAEPATGQAEPATGAAAEPGGLLVANAGLVLLHPFLTRFLEGLGVAAGDELLDPDRALALLHHLATGELTAPEHRLTLAKVLLGVPSDRPNDADVGLTEAETAEATALLEAAIGHWDALRSTSPEALRVEFLQRPGVLAQTPDGDWLLRVEGRTVDILLDQLPWGLSSFRLPWMGRLMMVEWR